MTKLSIFRGAAMVSALLLAGCSVEVTNLRPAQELARNSKPPGSVYVGWRVFQERCARCHGAEATGGAGGPSLLPIVREMGPRRFMGLVLNRYDWNLPPDQASRESVAQKALIEDILQRKEDAFVMPAWQTEPSVNAHIVDLYTYLAARAEGSQGPGRPER
jgi:mono/diheme cytochrome c family protein